MRHTKNKEIAFVSWFPFSQHCVLIEIVFWNVVKRKNTTTGKKRKKKALRNSEGVIIRRRRRK